MSPKSYARKMFSEVKEEGILSYMRRHREEGGNLQEESIPSLLASSKEGLLHQISYIKTLEHSISILGALFAELVDNIETGEEPLSTDNIELINNINKLLGAE